MTMLSAIHSFDATNLRFFNGGCDASWSWFSGIGSRTLGDSHEAMNASVYSYIVLLVKDGRKLEL